MHTILHWVLLSKYFLHIKHFKINIIIFEIKYSNIIYNSSCIDLSTCIVSCITSTTPFWLSPLMALTSSWTVRRSVTSLTNVTTLKRLRNAYLSRWVIESNIVYSLVYVLVQWFSKCGASSCGTHRNLRIIYKLGCVSTKVSVCVSTKAPPPRHLLVS